MNIRVRPETPGDIEAIDKVTVEAFRNAPHTEHTEQYIVKALRKAGALTISLVAEVDGEVAAVKLVEAVRGGLPHGLICGMDGPRVFLQDTRSGEELTIHSLEHAWRVIESWKEEMR